MRLGSRLRDEAASDAAGLALAAGGSATPAALGEDDHVVTEHPSEHPNPGGLAGAWTRISDLYHGRTPTTAAGLDRVVALLIVGLRLGTLVQMAPSLTVGLSLSPNQPLYALSFALACLASIAVTLRVLVRDDRLGARAYLLDVSLAAALLVAGIWCVPEEQRLGSWVGFQPGYAMSVLCSGAGIRNTTLWLAGLMSVVLADISYRLPQLTSANLSTAIGNILAYVVLVAVARFAMVFTRRVAADGDRARAEAAELARREEERRAQLAFHNGTAVMRLLADPDLDPKVREVLQAEARREATRMRSYLSGQGAASPPASGPRRLTTQVQGTCARYADLPVHTALDLASEVHVNAEVATAIDHALAALLLNIRDHSGANRVVVHGDSIVEDGIDQWVLTVHDNGCGFDPDPARWGVGLREVVHGQLTDLGVDVTITSSTLGSTAVLRGHALGPEAGA